MRTVLCVEDELKILENHREFFTEQGFAVLAAENAAKARELLAANTPDVILLDIMLPDGNGLDLLTEWRAAGIRTPIVMLTAWGKPQDISRGYKLGATAYLSKPFDYDAVLAVLEGIFRSAEKVPDVITRGPLTLKIMSDEAFLHGNNLLLTQKEFSLLVLFMQNEGRVINAEYLYEKVWGQPMAGNNGAVKNQVSNLRKKLKGSGCTVTPRRGEGYCFEPWQEDSKKGQDF